MKTDIEQQLAEYGSLHRANQEPLQFEDVTSIRLHVSAAPDYGRRRMIAALSGVAFVAVVIGIPVLVFDGPATEPPLAEPIETLPAVAPESIPDETAPEPVHPDEPIHEGYAMVTELDDGSLVGVSQGTVWRSEDGGSSWQTWYEQSSEIDVITKASDGAIIAIRNFNTDIDTFGSDSYVNETPEVHRFDPTTEQWSVIKLPRPDFPGAGSPEPIDNTETECVRSGLESWVDGNSAVVGDRIVVLGDQRVIGKGICEGDFQFLWTSDDGIQWELIPQIGVDGYFAGFVWTGDQYIAYGSPRPHFIGGGGPTPQIWTSTDLQTWTERTPDFTGLPAEWFVSIGPAGVTGFLGGTSVHTTTGPDGTTLSFVVGHYRPGLDESIGSLDELEGWLAEAGAPKQADPSLGELLAASGIDFPLDEDELFQLNHMFDIKEPIGTLTLSSTDGSEWVVDYQP